MGTLTRPITHDGHRLDEHGVTPVDQITTPSAARKVWAATRASGALMMALMWAAALLPENNPFMDDHLIDALVLVGLALVHAGDTWGLGARWRRTELVQRYPFLS